MAGGSFAGGLGFGLAFSLYDNFTGSAAKISASMTGLNKVVEKTTSGVTKELAALGGTLGAAFAVGSAVNMAAKMSDTLLGLADVTGMTSNEINKMRGEFEQMNTRRSVEELLNLAATGKQLGVAQNDLVEFARVADIVGTAIGNDFGGADQAATAIAKLSKNFADTKGLDVPTAIGNIGNALDAMTDVAKVNASEISSFATILGQMGVTSASAAIGLGTAAQELGLKSKQVAASVQAMQKMGGDDKKLAVLADTLGMTAEKTKELSQTAPEQLMLSLANSLGKMSSTKAAETMDALKITGSKTAIVLKTLGANSELVNKRMDMAAQSMGNMDGITSDANKQNMSLAGQLARVARAFTNLWTRIGEVIGQALSPFIDMVIWAANALTAFLASDTGQEVMRWASAFAIGVGALMALSKAVTIVKFAFKYLTTTVRSTLVSMAPLLIAAAPFILLVAGIKMANDAFSEFSGTVKDGFGGFLQKAGGILAVIREVWSSWDSVNGQFSISEGLMAKLEQLGIKNLAIAVATWVVRVREFFNGVASGFTETFNFVYSVVAAIFSPIKKLLKAIGFDLDRNRSSVKSWAKAGKIAGGVIVVALAAVAVYLGIIAVQSFIAFLPMIIMIAAIGIAIYVVIKVFQLLWSWLKIIWSWISPLVEYGKAIVQAIWDGIVYLWDTFTSWIYSAWGFLWDDIIAPMYDVGYNIVMSIWDGIKGMWGTMVDWITSSLAAIPGVSYLLDLQTPAELELLKAAEAGQKFTTEQLASMKGLGQLSDTGMQTLYSKGAISNMSPEQAASMGLSNDTGITPVQNASLAAGAANKNTTTVNVPKQKVPQTTVNVVINEEVVGKAAIKYTEDQTSRE